MKPIEPSSRLLAEESYCGCFKNILNSAVDCIRNIISFIFNTCCPRNEMERPALEPARVQVGPVAPKMDLRLQREIDSLPVRFNRKMHVVSDLSDIVGGYPNAGNAEDCMNGLRIFLMPLLPLLKQHPESFELFMSTAVPHFTIYCLNQDLLDQVERLSKQHSDLMEFNRRNEPFKMNKDQNCYACITPVDKRYR